MLRQCIERCPDDLWASGKNPRYFWRIAYHALFYTDLYMGQTEDAYKPWRKHVESATELYDEQPPMEPYTKAESLEYLDQLMARVPTVADSLDLESEDTGFHWYKKMTKLDHELMNLRHLQGHVGQLSELLMANGIDTEWIGKGPTKLR